MEPELLQNLHFKLLERFKNKNSITPADHRSLQCCVRQQTSKFVNLQRVYC